MKKKEKQILIQEYRLLRNEFLTVVDNRGEIKGRSYLLDQKITTPYLCYIINKIFGSESALSTHFYGILSDLENKAPKTYLALWSKENLKPEYPTAPFSYEEVDLRLMLIDEIIESLS